MIKFLKFIMENRKQEIKDFGMIIQLEQKEDLSFLIIANISDNKNPFHPHYHQTYSSTKI